jgi:predicted transcriptional regulator
METPKYRFRSRIQRTNLSFREPEETVYEIDEKRGVLGVHYWKRIFYSGQQAKSLLRFYELTEHEKDKEIEEDSVGIPYTPIK